MTFPWEQNESSPALRQCVRLNLKANGGTLRTNATGCPEATVKVAQYFSARLAFENRCRPVRDDR